MSGSPLRRRPVRDGVVDPQRQAAFAAEGLRRRRAMGVTPAAPMRQFDSSGQEIAPLTAQQQGPLEVRPLSSAPASAIRPANTPVQGPRTGGQVGVPLMQFEQHQMNGIRQNLPPADAMGLREQAFQQEGRRLDAQFQMAQRNQQERAKYYGKSGNAAGMQHVGLRPPQEDSGYMAGLGAQADQMIASGATPQPGMASIPPEQVTTFNRGQLRQPGVYDPGYGQVQGSAPAPGVRPGGYGLYGQGSYQNMGSPAANEPVNEYGLRRTPTAPGADRRPGDANLDTTKGRGVDGNGGQILGAYGQGAQLIRGADGRNRVVGQKPTGERAEKLEAARQKRLESGLQRREMAQAERYNKGLERQGLRPSREDMGRAFGMPGTQSQAGPGQGSASIPLPSPPSGSVVKDAQTAKAEQAESRDTLNKTTGVLDPIMKRAGKRTGVPFDQYTPTEIMDVMDHPETDKMSQEDQDAFRSSVGHYLRSHPRDSFNDPTYYDEMHAYASGDTKKRDVLRQGRRKYKDNPPKRTYDPQVDSIPAPIGMF